jgi:hypothetical protein
VRAEIDIAQGESSGASRRCVITFDDVGSRFSPQCGAAEKLGIRQLAREDVRVLDGDRSGRRAEPVTDPGAVLAEAGVEDDRVRVEQGAEWGQRPPEGGGDGVDRSAAIGSVVVGFEGAEHVLADDGGEASPAAAVAQRPVRMDVGASSPADPVAPRWSRLFTTMPHPMPAAASLR